MITLRRYCFMMDRLGFIFRMWFFWRCLIGKERFTRRRERYGVASSPPFESPPVWIHAVSVGELISVLPFVHELRSRGINVLVTSSTKGSLNIIEQRLPRGAIHQLLPLDKPTWVSRFLDHWQPVMALFTESDIWPGYFYALSQRNVPVVLVNGRLSVRSIRLWGRFPRFRDEVFGLINRAYVQDKAYEQGLISLGLKRISFVGNLKLDAPPLAVDQAELDDWREHKGDKRFIVAASIHAGEEAVILDAFSKLYALNSNLVLCIIPRHPDKMGAMCARAKASGFSIEMFSQHRQWRGQSQIWFDDAFNRLGLFYRLADQVWLGGSWIRKGGHNPFEPVQLGAPVLHGPSYENFVALYPALGQTCQLAENSDILARKAHDWLDNNQAQLPFVGQAMQNIKTHYGARIRLYDDLKHHWPHIFTG